MRTPTTRFRRGLPLPRVLSLGLLPLLSIIGSAPAAGQCEVQELRGLELEGQKQAGFGYSLSVSGNTAFVGNWWEENGTTGNGTVYVFERDGSGWRRTDRLLPSTGKSYYSPVVVRGDRAVVGAWRKSALAGKAFFYDRTPAGWQEVTVVTASDLEFDDEYAFSVAIDGDTAIVGSPKDDDFSPAEPQCNSGSAYLYQRTASGWLEVQKLTASDPGCMRFFGTSVAIEGDRLVVGAYTVLNPQWSGALYVFEHTPGAWVQVARLQANEHTNNMWFALSTDLSGDRIVTGAAQFDGKKGAAFVFEKIGGNWMQTGTLQAGDGAQQDQFGASVAIDGDRILVGASGDDDAGPDTGAAYLFERHPNGWVQSAKLLASEPAKREFFGWSVALEGETALIGAPIVPWMQHYDWGTAHCFSLPLGTSQFCFGSDCPCGNDHTFGGCLNSTGESGRLSSCGSVSVTADDLVLTASRLPASTLTLLGMGYGRTSIPWGDGRLCIGDGGVGRFRFRTCLADGSGTILEGPGLVAATHAGFDTPGHITFGQTWNFQFFYRDGGTAACGGGLNTTNALAATFEP